MGLAQIRRDREPADRAHGLSTATPVAAITDGCDRRQRVVRTTLEHVADAATGARPGGPTLFVIGRVVDVHRPRHGLGDRRAA